MDELESKDIIEMCVDIIVFVDKIIEEDKESTSLQLIHSYLNMILEQQKEDEVVTVVEDVIDKDEEEEVFELLKDVKKDDEEL